MEGALIDIAAIEQAVAVVGRVAHWTPLLTSKSLSKIVGADLTFKAENLQRTGSFKIRGAQVFIDSLDPGRRARGVVTASAGNHAQGVALAAAEHGIEATVVMPEGAAVAKVVATRGYGAAVLLRGANYDEAVEFARALADERGLVYVPAFDDHHVIAGQGTIGMEILDECPDASLLLVPIGGGGLISGIATAVKARRPGVRVIGVQASGAAGCALSWRDGRIVSTDSVSTIADGIAVKHPGSVTFPIIQRYVDDIVTVPDEAISQAIVLLLERMKLIVEGAGAVGLAALLTEAVRPISGKTVLVLSGGNLDSNLLGRVVQHGLTAAGRYLVLRTHLADRPGALVGLLGYLASEGANILEIEHHRLGIDLPLEQVEVVLTLETRDADHSAEIRRELLAGGYGVVAISGQSAPRLDNGP